MKQAQKMQQQLVEAQAQLAQTEVVGTAGGGLVTATVTGSGDVLSVKIDPSAVDPDDIESLEDLVVAAIRDASTNAPRRPWPPTTSTASRTWSSPRSGTPRPTPPSCSRAPWARWPAGSAASACR